MEREEYGGVGRGQSRGLRREGDLLNQVLGSDDPVCLSFPQEAPVLSCSSPLGPGRWLLPFSWVWPTGKAKDGRMRVE